MRRLFVTEFLAVDGVMQAPGDPNEDRSGGFDLGGWQLAFFDDIFANAVMDGLAATGAFLLGRRTYEIFAAHWPKQSPQDPLAATFNDLPKYVASRTLREPLAWQNSTLIRGEVAAGVRKLKAQNGRDIQVIGSGELVRSLIDAGIVDELRLMVHPIVLGRGKRLFDDSSSARLRLVDSKTTTKGVVLLTYVPEPKDAAAR